jgi:UTP--glucose-1-phosphate uridylyltransferase
MNQHELLRKNMVEAKISPLQIDTFLNHYETYLAGNTGLIPESDLEPVSRKDVVSFDELTDYVRAGEAMVANCVIIKLNGGLATSMGLHQPKSLLEIKPGKTFIDLIVEQNIKLRKNNKVQVPLLFMNSYSTRESTIGYIQKNYPQFSNESLPLDFMQSMVPRIDAENDGPVELNDPQAQWCPPGHGDIYNSLVVSGLLDKLLDAGKEIAFISNSDNIGATLDYGILGYMLEEEVPFLMEVAQRTQSDKKGGHLALGKKGQYLLREVAQCPKEDIDEFQDISKYRYFNTNNLWINLKALKSYYQQKKYLDMPLIVNKKQIADSSRNYNVVQLETAMGSAITPLKGKPVLIKRDRFMPVKHWSDLIALQSDAYEIDENFNLSLSKERALKSQVKIVWDNKIYANEEEIKKRFDFNKLPSMVDLEKLEIIGDVTFAKDIILKGNVKVGELGQKTTIPEGTTLQG